MRARTSRTVTRLPLFIALIGALLVGAGCGEKGDVTISKSDDPRSGGQSGFDVTTTERMGGPTPTSVGDPSIPTTVAPIAVPDDDGEALRAAVAAYAAALGTPTIRTLEFTVQFPQGQASYGYLQSQDPLVAANIDQRDWREGVVSDPKPVRITGDAANLESNLFSLDEIDWATVAANLATAPGAVEGKLGPLSNSAGVTHLIAERDLPFSEAVVVRIYVDGGDRTTGGYVQYLANGQLDKVQA